MAYLTEEPDTGTRLDYLISVITTYLGGEPVRWGGPNRASDDLSGLLVAIEQLNSRGIK